MFDHLTSTLRGFVAGGCPAEEHEHLMRQLTTGLELHVTTFRGAAEWRGERVNTRLRARQPSTIRSDRQDGHRRKVPLQAPEVDQVPGVHHAPTAQGRRRHDDCVGQRRSAHGAESLSGRAAQ